MRQARFEVVDQADEPVRLRRVGMSPKQGAVAKLVERVPAAGVAAFFAAVPNIFASLSSAC
jgi:hypothetical protein